MVKMSEIKLWIPRGSTICILKGVLPTKELRDSLLTLRVYKPGKLSAESCIRLRP
ncbi:uncharacterized protein EKO05_0002801 [Ascochyta rabiei]|uniref:uncharacterized protein n=1 Tax=Didymella rabiei TaxID=5454 RepID=UPI002206837F|nr:uncharacterized protein EKO05_0002801 [Ascochyta rabiei]UPX12245.1 hypothetical protein EKO05_0002801 [Ascochyta rabiei]